MKRFLAAIAFALSLGWLASPPAAAQSLGLYRVVTSCGSWAYEAGTNQLPTQDTAGHVCTGAGGAGGGAVYGPTAVGSAAANPPVLFGGTANATATGNVQVAKIDSSGNIYIVCSSGCFQTTQPVSGTVTANAGTGSFTVTQATASNLNATVVGAGTAGTPSGGVVSVQGVASGTTLPVTPSDANGDKAVYCTANTYQNVSTGTDTQLVALSSGKAIYVCSYAITNNTTSAQSVYLEYATGASCSTLTQITSTLVTGGQVPGVSRGSGQGAIVFVPAGDALCVHTTAAVAVTVDVTYAQF